MTLEETLTQLEALGNEKTRAQDAGQGAGDSHCAVRLGDIRGLVRRIEAGRELGMAPGETGASTPGSWPSS